MKQWEYSSFTEPANQSINRFTDHLNKAGEEGWELVCVIGYTFILKREKSRLAI